MKRKLIIAAFTLATLLTSLMPSKAQFIQDNAQLFSNQVISESNRSIKDLKNQTKKEIFVQTEVSIPDIDSAAATVFSNQRVNGVLVFVTSNPRKIAVRVGPKTAILFDEYKQKEVRQTFIRGYKNGGYDSGLTDTVDYVKNVFLSNFNSVPSNTKVNTIPNNTPQSYNSTPQNTPVKSGFSFWKLLFWAFVLWVAYKFFTRKRRGYDSSNYRPYPNQVRSTPNYDNDNSYGVNRNVSNAYHPPHTQTYQREPYVSQPYQAPQKNTFGQDVVSSAIGSTVGNYADDKLTNKDTKTAYGDDNESSNNDAREAYEKDSKESVGSSSFFEESPEPVSSPIFSSNNDDFGGGSSGGGGGSDSWGDDNDNSGSNDSAFSSDSSSADSSGSSDSF